MLDLEAALHLGEVQTEAVAVELVGARIVLGEYRRRQAAWLVRHIRTVELARLPVSPFVQGQRRIRS